MTRVSVLDHGYVEPVTYWGSEEDIIASARMSTGKGFLGWDPEEDRTCDVCRGKGVRRNDRPPWNDEPCARWENGSVSCAGTGIIKGHPGDARLLKYLWKMKHSTPFEMAGATFEAQAPIFVFREWHRHRVPFGYSEMSARYTPLPDVNYIPSVDRLLKRGPGFESTSKQAGTVAGAAELDEKGAEVFRAQLGKMYRDQETLYQDALNRGVPKELARVLLPVGRYSRHRATGNLRGWLAFLALRVPSDAQWEIRSYANAIHAMLSEKFPRTLALFDETRRA